MKRFSLLTCFVITAICSMALPTVSPLYVAQGGEGDGSSWASPLGSIVEALNIAAATPGDVRPDIWIKGGTFLINSCEDRLRVGDSISIYGSFAGTETSVDQRPRVEGGRPWEFENATIIDGQHQWPLYMSLVHKDTTDHDYPNYVDGLIFLNGSGIVDSTAEWKSPTFARFGTVYRYCQAIGNETYQSGAGFGGWPAFNVISCLAKNNHQYDDPVGGGGISLNTSTFGQPGYIVDCDIVGNTSNVRGGGINTQGESMVYIINCRIYNNSVTKNDDGSYKSGGSIYSGTKTIMYNNLIYNNTGSLYLAPHLFANNTIVNNIGAIYIASAWNDSYFVNNILWGMTTDESGHSPTTIGGVAAELKACNNISYHPFPTNKGWRLHNNIQFSSNSINEEVPQAEFGCGSGPYFNKYTSFVGAIPNELSAEEKEAFEAELDDPELFRITLESPSFNTGIEPIDTVMTVTRKIVGGRPKSDTTYAYYKHVLDDYSGVKRPQGSAYDMGAYELPYCKLRMSYDSHEGMIVSEMGNVVPNDSTLEVVSGQQVIIYVMNMSEKEMKAFLVESTDDGNTYTGPKTEITHLIDDSGQLILTTTVTSMLQLIFEEPQALPVIDLNYPVTKVIKNRSIQIVKDGKVYSILGTRE